MPFNLLTIRPFALRLSLAAMAATLLSGCQSIQGTSAASPELRVVNVSPTGGLDFYLGKTGFVYGLGFPYSSSYVPISSGTYTVSAAPSGSSSVADAIASTSVGVASGKQYTVVAGNVPASLELTAYLDQSSPAPTGSVSFRFLDQATSVGAVDLYLVPQGGKLTTTNPIVTGLTFDSNSGYITVPNGTYQLVVLSTGTVPIATTITLLTGASQVYSAGVARTIVLADNPYTTTQPVQVKYLCDYDPPGTVCNL